MGGLPGIDVEHKETRTPMAMGEFDLVKEIIDKFGDAARVAKCQVDKLVDMAAPPPATSGRFSSERRSSTTLRGTPPSSCSASTCACTAPRGSPSPSGSSWMKMPTSDL